MLLRLERESAHRAQEQDRGSGDRESLRDSGVLAGGAVAVLLQVSEKRCLAFWVVRCGTGVARESVGEGTTWRELGCEGEGGPGGREVRTRMVS